LPYKCYRIESIVKANQEKIIFIAKGVEKVLFTLKVRGNDSAIYYPNDVVEYKDPLIPLPTPKSLNGFVYADYLTQIGVDSTAYPKAFPRLVYRNSLGAQFFASKLKNYIVSYLLSFSNITDSTKAFTIALITGDKSFLNKNGYKLFRESGVIHVLAISGLHVGILYVTLYFFFSKLLRLNNKIVSYLIALILIGYAFITGLSPSVIRAVIMFSLIQFGRSYNKTTNTLNIVFSSAFLMLFYEPDLIVDVGFQLSYSAVIGIVLTMQYSGLQSLVKKKYLSISWNVLLVNFAAFFFTMPVISFHFGVVNFTSIWASVFVVPIITIALYLGVLLLILSFNNYFAEKVFFILDYLFNGLSRLLNFIVDYLHYPCHFSLGSFGVVLSFFILFFLITRKLNWVLFIILFFGVIFYFPNHQVVQALKLKNEVQIKYKHQIFTIKKGDSILFNNCKILTKDLNTLEVHKFNNIRIIDFNVNNYQNLILDF